MWSEQCLAIKLYVVFIILFSTFFLLSIDKFKNANTTSVTFIVGSTILISFLVIFGAKKLCANNNTNWAYVLLSFSSLLIVAFSFAFVF